SGRREARQGLPERRGGLRHAGRRRGRRRRRGLVLRPPPRARGHGHAGRVVDGSGRLASGDVLMRRATSALALALVLAGAAAGCYAHDIVSGSLRCGAGASCPDGYSCNMTDKTCWKDGEKPSTTPLGGKLDSFVGRWPFTKQATGQIDCSDGSHGAIPL